LLNITRQNRGVVPTRTALFLSLYPLPTPLLLGDCKKNNNLQGRGFLRFRGFHVSNRNPECPIRYIILNVDNSLCVAPLVVRQEDNETTPDKSNIYLYIVTFGSLFSVPDRPPFIIDRSMRSSGVIAVSFQPGVTSRFSFKSPGFSEGGDRSPTLSTESGERKLLSLALASNIQSGSILSSQKDCQKRQRSCR